MTHTETTEMASGSHRLCFVLGLHSEALPSSWGFQWYNVKARSTEVGFEEGIKEEKMQRAEETMENYTQMGAGADGHTPG